MKLCWPHDTIAWRFGMVISSAIAVTSALMGLFFAFGGVWAQPPKDLRALLDGFTVVVEIINAAPTESRPHLASAPHIHGNKLYRMVWYPAGSTPANWFENARKYQRLPHKVAFFDSQLGRPFVLIGPEPVLRAGNGFPLALQNPENYYLAVKLSDSSWLIAFGRGHKWGLSNGARMAILLAVFLFVAAGISAVATRQISSPIRKFAKAVHAAGVNPNAAPIAAMGPMELREVIAAFNGMQAKIAAFVAYRTAMLAAISHDLRTPLTRMRLRGEYIADQVQRERLFGDVLEMQAMVDGALAFFRGDGDEEPVRTFDLSGLLQSVADGFADQGIDVGYAEGERVVYSGRAIAIKRAVTNLMENAVKYGATPRMTLTGSKTEITITVRDYGPGIPAEALEAVFEPFYRLDKSRHKARGGVGLGLTAARAVIRGHGGDILLHNHPEGGLEATVILPRVASTV